MTVSYEQKVRDVVACPACQARVCAPCTEATTTGRRIVTWNHASRQAAYEDVAS